MFRTVMSERRRSGGWWRPGHSGGGGGMLTTWLVAMVAVVGPQVVLTETLLPPPCNSEIYCYGDLLKTVQMTELHNDSKYFVDMSLKNSPNDTLRAFHSLMNDTLQNPTKEEIRNFVADYFDEPGAEFEEWNPNDWNNDPEFLKKVEDPELEKWGQELNKVWKQLGRKISSKVQDEPEKYSQIFVNHPVIVPGGRFREFYYWDSYWTIDGLLLSGMKETVKGMLENFLQMVQNYGMVPNGGRVYYTRRSQPPYLIPMVKLYLDYTNDLNFLEENIDLLQKEFLFWENERSVEIKDREGKTHKVAQYRVQVGEPRPEAFREDYKLVQGLETDEQEQLYVELKSGAESGWDYSTRWFVNSNNTNKGTLKNLKVTNIVPVDLNSLLCLNARTLSEFYRKIGNYTLTKQYEDMANSKNDTMSKIFWDRSDGMWYDYDIKAQSKRRYFYLSNIHPIWSGCYGQEDSRAVTLDKVINYLNSKGVTKYVGGIPTSLEANSGLQWDFPNAWAPLQHLAIMGLHNARFIHHAAGSMSFSLAEKWIRTNWKGYQQSTPHSMFEKYNVSVVGLSGGGGEYPVQLGFGWSNGVALRLLDLFGDRLTATTGAAPSLSAISLLALLPLTFMSMGAALLF